MSRMAPCPSCAKTVAVSMYGKCVLCGQVITEAAPPTVPRRNGLALLGMILGALLVLVGVGAMVRTGSPVQVGTILLGVVLCSAGWRFRDAPSL